MRQCREGRTRRPFGLVEKYSGVSVKGEQKIIENTGATKVEKRWNSKQRIEWMAGVGRCFRIGGMTGVWWQCGGEEDGVDENKGKARNEEGCEASGQWAVRVIEGWSGHTRVVPTSPV